MSEGVGGVGGGSTMSMIGGLVGSYFGGPVGGMMGSACGELLQESVGGAATDAGSQLQREDGMPSFIADQLKKVVEDAMKQLMPEGVNASDRQDAFNQYGSSLQNFARELTQQIVDAVRKELQGQAGTSGAPDAASAPSATDTAPAGNTPSTPSTTDAAGKPSAPGATAPATTPSAPSTTETAGTPSTTNTAPTESAANVGAAKQGGEVTGESWLMAIAKAMGSMMGDKAADLVKLSKEMQNHSTAGQGGATAASTSGGKGAESNQALSSQEQGAKDSSEMNSQFQTASQEFKMLQEAFNTVVKTLGEAVAAMAKQH